MSEDKPKFALPQKQIDGGMLLERWRCDSLKLCQLLTIFKPSAYVNNKWIKPENNLYDKKIEKICNIANMLSKDKFQKDLLARAIRFNLADIEQIEENYPDILKHEDVLYNPLTRSERVRREVRDALNKQDKSTINRSQHKCNNNVQDSMKNTASPPNIPDNNCDPSQNTLLNHWIIKDNILKISVYTKGEKEGEASFELSHGTMSKQRVLMMKLFETQKITVGKIIELCYESERKNLTRDDHKGASSLLAKVRSLVSGIRTKKLRDNGINMEIITPLGPDISVESTVSLIVNKVQGLDEKHLKSKDITSYMPPDELPSKDKTDSILDDSDDYNPDKYINGFVDDSDD